MTLVTFDTIIRNGRWFDGTGGASALRSIGIRDGHVVAISPDELDPGHLRIGDRADAVVLDPQRLDGRFTDLVGATRTGRFLRAAHRSPAQPTAKGELSSVS
jgi:N-acyl-D-aspartate/D-glutamate deacylase